MGARQYDESFFKKTLELKNKGLRPYEIARAINVNPSTICEWFRKINSGQERIQRKIVIERFMDLSKVKFK